jgi:hypothetical protein
VGGDSQGVRLQAHGLIALSAGIEGLLLALFGHHATSDLGPQCAPKWKSGSAYTLVDLDIHRALPVDRGDGRAFVRCPFVARRPFPLRP